MSDVNKISSSRVNTTNKQRIKQLGISLSSICILFFFALARDHVHISRGKSLAPGSQLQPCLGFIHVVIAHTDQFHVV